MAESVEARVAAHEATLGQMNERLGSLETGVREGLREIRDELRGLNTRVATKGELRFWAGLISAWIAAAVGIILKFR